MTEYVLQQNGERYLPWSNDFLTGYEHVHRYLLAVEYARNARVLDVACGEGYGTEMLAHVAKSVVGIDIDSTTIAHAQHYHGNMNTVYIQADAQRFALAPGCLDLVVSYETLEHFDEHEPFLESIKCALAATGTLIISTPNRLTYSDEQHRNPFHKRELSQDEFLTLLKGYFKNVFLLGQNMILSSIIAQDHGDHFVKPNEFYHASMTNVDPQRLNYPIQTESALKPRYYIAICSDVEIANFPGDILIDTKGTAYHNLVPRIENLQTALGEQWDKVYNLNLQLAQRDQLAQTLSTSIEGLSSTIQSLSAYIRHRDQQLEHLSARVNESEQGLQERTQETQQLAAQLKESEQRLQETQQRATQRKEDERRLQGQLQEGLQRVNQLSCEIVNQRINYEKRLDYVDTHYQNLYREYQAIQVTGFWRLINAWWRFERRLLSLVGGQYTSLYSMLRIRKHKVVQGEKDSKGQSQLPVMPVEPVLANESPDLREPAPNLTSTDFTAKFSALVEECKEKSDHEVAILDWDTGLNLAKWFPHYTIFSPPQKTTVATKLYYLDQTIDIVVIASSDTESVSEAQRVASCVVVNLNDTDTLNQNPHLHIEWQTDLTTDSTLPSVSIIISSFNHIDYTRNCVKQLSRTIPRTLKVEILIVDDCSPQAETQEQLGELEALDDRVKVIRNSKNGGFVAVCNLGVKIATGDVVIMLNNDTSPQPGWLQPLLSLLRDTPHAGAVGGKLVYPDGTLQEAGGIVFSDASAWNFGKHFDPNDPLFNYVREVDYCSGALLATWRSLWNELGGFDLRYSPGYYEDTDYCLTMKTQGYRVYYQPASVVTHFEGVTNGTEKNPGDLGVKAYQVTNKIQFAEKWQEVLKHQPTPPSEYNMTNLQRLAILKESE